MKGRLFVLVISLLIVLALGAAGATAQEEAPRAAPQNIASQGVDAAAAALGAAFTYQGRLMEGGALANGYYDFQFQLFDEVMAGIQLGSTITQTIAVNTGYFTTQLDFGEVFDGDARYLEIGVKTAGSLDPYTILVPRQALTPVPYALALPGLWTQQNATSPNLIGGFNRNQVAAGVVGATISGGGEGGSINIVSANYGTVGGGFGNSVSGSIAVIGGGQHNVATASGATVAGGFTNAAQGDGSTVSGGANNTASVLRATVGGGAWNTASGSTATIGGGDNNVASGERAVIGGGYGNKAEGAYATVAGGNTNTAAVEGATVGGGTWNIANGQGSTVAGGGSVGAGNVASGAGAAVGGGIANTAAGGNAAIAGGQQNGAPGGLAAVGGGFSNVAQGDSSTVSGGTNNLAAGVNAAIGGGQLNSAAGGWATVPGGSNNSAAGAFSFAAGRRAKALHDGAFVWGDSTDADLESTAQDEFVVRASGGISLTLGSGAWRFEPHAESPNLIGGSSANVVTGGVVGATISGGGEGGSINTVSANYGTVGGGFGNSVSGSISVIGGGQDNVATASGATVAGGFTNAAQGDGSTVSGGANNTASVLRATVSGGAWNTASGSTATIGGGDNNVASGERATVGGGYGNKAQGDYATVAGGNLAQASVYGQMAHASGAFASAGDAQTSVYVLRNTTTDAILAALYLDGVAQRLGVASGRTLAFEILIVGRSDAGASGGYRIQGMIENNAGTTALVGFTSTTILGEDVGAWNAAASADDANDALNITVSGAANTTIRWVATVRTAEVAW